jgi:hypothetical protein
MITPSFSLTATERVLPNMALDFTTASLDSRVTFTRSGNTATVINSSGVITAINANLPRFDYNPTTLLCNGLLIEESRTNVLLNSLIDGTVLGTQAVVVTAAARTLSFYGTGQVVLSGAASATVTGTGAYPTRTTFTFTPTAGALTLTVTGTVQFAQLELGSFATSYIPTAASQVTRTADVVTMTGTNFSSWFNATEGAFQSQYQSFDTSTAIVINANDTSFNNYIEISKQFATNSRTRIAVAGVLQTTLTTTVVSGAIANSVVAYKLNNIGYATNAETTQTDTSATIPTVTQLSIGDRPLADSALNGWVRKINYYPQRITNAEIQAFSK